MSPLEKRIKELEEKVKVLESRPIMPQIIPMPYPVPTPYPFFPIYPQPWWGYTEINANISSPDKYLTT